ncbi:MAG: DsbA family protein, partial [Rhodospirillaceae bacterium]|nr:DsbA family protein [Rhodospirillaceae bacterium]
LSAVLLCGATAVAADETLVDLTREEIEVIVRDYLVEHPEVVIEALRAYEKQLADQQAAEADRAMTELADEIFNDPETPFGGDPDGEIVIVEFFDYRCGYCRRSAPDLFALRDEMDGVKVIYKEFPILGDASRLAAVAALAARNQGLYEPFHELLMTAESNFSEAEILDLAEYVGLDTDQLREDMADPEIQAYLSRTDTLARTLGVGGTPAFIVNGTLYPGALSRSDFERLIEAAGG